MAAGPHHPDRPSKRPGGGTYTVQAGPARPAPPDRDRSVRREPRGAAYYAENRPSPLGFVAAILAGFAFVMMVLLYFIFAGTDPDSTPQAAPAEQPDTVE